MTIKKFFSFKDNKFFWLNIVGMVLFAALVIWGALKALDVYTHHGEAVEVPDVKGMAVEEAQSMLRSRDLVGVVADSTYVEGRPFGVILETNPNASQKVKKGRVVRFTINSLSIPMVEVPDIVENSSLREAEAKVVASGFKLDSIQYVPGEKDWVYGLKFRGRTLMNGEKVPMGATLVIVAGNGGNEEDEEEETDRELMDVLGSTAAETDDSWF